jgi:hypothetical protein
MERKTDRVKRIFGSFIRVVHPNYGNYDAQYANELYEAFVAGMVCYLTITEDPDYKHIEDLKIQIPNAQIEIFEFREQKI